MKQLIFVRHGMPDEGHLTRPHDPPLNEIGLSQAEELAKHLSRAGVDLIVSSPQMRAQNTAAPLAAALRLPIETVNDFGRSRPVHGSLPVSANHSPGVPRPLGGFPGIPGEFLRPRRQGVSPRRRKRGHRGHGARGDDHSSLHSRDAHPNYGPTCARSREDDAVHYRPLLHHSIGRIAYRLSACPNRQ